MYKVQTYLIIKNLMIKYKYRKNRDYSLLVKSISLILNKWRRQAYNKINNILIKTYWQIGERIIEFEQKWEEKAEYGTNLLNNLAKDLRSKNIKGFSRRNLLDMRRFYMLYPTWQTVSAELSWSHYVQLISISSDLARSFYENQCIREKRSIRELNRQKNSALFERIAIGKNKEDILILAKNGQRIQQASDIIKEPYVLEFLNIQENYQYSEKELEQKLIDNLQLFLLGLGKGFTFVKRQFRISY